MIGLRDLNNVDIAKIPGDGILVEAEFLLKNLDEVTFEENKSGYHIKYRDKKLYLRVSGVGHLAMRYVENRAVYDLFCVCKVQVGNVLRSLLIGTKEEMRKVLNGNPKPVVHYAPSLLDGINGGYCLRFPTFQHLKGKVRCVTSNGKSTSISCNITYPLEIVFKMDTVLFTMDHPKIQDDNDFFFCIPTPHIYFTLLSPTENYGRFGK